MSSNFVKFICILLLLMPLERGSLLFSTGSNIDEGQCEGLPDCVCMKISSAIRNRTKLVCENEMNVDASSGIYFHPFRYFTILKVFCSPDVNPKHLLKDYYNLLKLKIFDPLFHIMSVVSCPEPPIPYSSFLSPPKSHVQDDIQFPTLNSLIINCSDYRRTFFLQRNHLHGLQSLKGLTIHCHTMYDLPSDIFFDTTPSLSTIAIESTKVLLLYNNSISTIFLDCRDDLNKLRLLDLRYNKIRRLQHHDIMFKSPNAPPIFPVKNTATKILHPRINNDPPPAPPPTLMVDLRGNLIQSVDIPLNKGAKINPWKSNL
ncbi:hypothetical protein J437_LFUL000129 [Ladona fulva]|uniref:Uncharacterized protein n=1 Tax=Ladona fulva TaxID=123851 RepID=A0A8K0P047_LADFU|nr:hypothetical protein J437_LFUL000129 [Ladona fulva]